MGSSPDRPTVLTPETQELIVRLLAEGNYLRTACSAAGISHAGFYHWQKRWEVGDPGAQRFHDFFDAVKRAGCVAEAEALRRVRDGGPGWQASAWFLERRFPRRWGRKDRPAAQPPPRPLDEMTDEEFDAYRRRVEGEGRRGDAR